MGVVYGLGCSGVLLLYGWKAFIEFRTKRPMRMALVGPKTPGVALVIVGKHLWVAALAWLVGVSIRSFF